MDTLYASDPGSSSCLFRPTRGVRWLEVLQRGGYGLFRLPPPLERGRATALWLDLEDPELADAAFAVRMALSVLRRVVTAWGEARRGGGGGVTGG